MNSVKYQLFYMELFCDMFGSVLECYESYQLVLPSSLGSHSRVSMHCYLIGCVIKSNHRGICSCSPIVKFLESTFYHVMVTSVIFLIKK